MLHKYHRASPRLYKNSVLHTSVLSPIKSSHVFSIAIQINTTVYFINFVKNLIVVCWQSNPPADMQAPNAEQSLLTTWFNFPSWHNWNFSSCVPAVVDSPTVLCSCGQQRAIHSRAPRWEFGCQVQEEANRQMDTGQRKNTEQKQMAAYDTAVYDTHFPHGKEQSNVCSFENIYIRIYNPRFNWHISLTETWLESQDRWQM